MPFPGHGSEVTALREQLWECHDALIQEAFMTRLSTMSRRSSCKLMQLTQPSDVMVGSYYSR